MIFFHKLYVNIPISSSIHYFYVYYILSDINQDMGPFKVESSNVCRYKTLSVVMYVYSVIEKKYVSIELSYKLQTTA